MDLTSNDTNDLTPFVLLRSICQHRSFCQVSQCISLQPSQNLILKRFSADLSTSRPFSSVPGVAWSIDSCTARLQDGKLTGVSCLACSLWIIRHVSEYRAPVWPLSLRHLLQVCFSVIFLRSFASPIANSLCAGPPGGHCKRMGTWHCVISLSKTYCTYWSEQ